MPLVNPTPESRFTAGLLFDVYAVLQQHGYTQPTDEKARNQAHAESLVALRNLVRAFEGKADA